MMDYRMFKEVAKDKVLDYLPPEMRNAEVLIADVWKVNQVREALRVVLPEQKKVLPNFYLDKLYEEYRKNRDIEAVIVELAEAVVAVNSVSEDYYRELKLSDMKENVVMELVNAEQNRELLKDVPYREFQDLAVIYRWIMEQDRTGTAGILVTNEVMEGAGLNGTELFNIAVENTKRIHPPTLSNISVGVLSKFLEESSDNLEPEKLDEIAAEMAETEPKEELWMIGNPFRLNGAASMLFEENLHGLAERMGTDLLILPVSVDEVFAISAEQTTVEKAADFVYEFNQTIPLEKRLSNKVYHYDRRLREISIAEGVPNRRLDGIVAEQAYSRDMDGRRQK